MTYTIEVAEAVTKTVGKFATLNGYQLAGHIANLEFWQSQLKHALGVIDGYNARQMLREEAQRAYITEHATREFDKEEKYLESSAQVDRHRIGKQQLQSVRRELADSYYRFVQRSHRARLLNKKQAIETLGACGIGAEPGDIDD